jgi:hypothetical protein
VGAGPSGELDRVFDVAAMTGELGTQHRYRPVDVRQLPLTDSPTGGSPAWSTVVSARSASVSSGSTSSARPLMSA